MADFSPLQHLKAQPWHEGHLLIYKWSHSLIAGKVLTSSYDPKLSVAGTSHGSHQMFTSFDGYLTWIWMTSYHLSHFMAWSEVATPGGRNYVLSTLRLEKSPERACGSTESLLEKASVTISMNIFCCSFLNDPILLIVTAVEEHRMRICKNAATSIVMESSLCSGKPRRPCDASLPFPYQNKCFPGKGYSGQGGCKDLSQSNYKCRSVSSPCPFSSGWCWTRRSGDSKLGKSRQKFRWLFSLEQCY